MINISSFVKNDWVSPKMNAAILRDAASNKAIAQIGHDGLPFGAMLDYARKVGSSNLRQMGFHDRAKMIKAVALFLMERKERLYELSYLTGATKADSAIDIDGGFQTMLVFASKGRKEMPDGQIYLDGNIEELSRDGSFKGIHIATPLLGAAVHINAFNFPVWGMLEKLAPTWLAGVPAIVKPASQTAYLAEATVRLIIESGLIPEGALQMIAGSTGDLFEHLSAQDVVSFTGSAETANKLRSHHNILHNSVRFIVEQDSLNATVLGSDVKLKSAEFDLFIKEVIHEITTKAGQKCTAIRRIFVPRPMLNAVSEALSQKLNDIKIGDPAKPETQMGALVSLAQCEDVRKKTLEINQEAEIIFGKIPRNFGQAAFFAPILFHCQDADNASRVHSIEAFGPVSTLMSYEDEAHAIHLVNKGKGSLVASIFTNSPEIARKFAYEAGPWHGRLYFNNGKSARASTGHGSPLPHLVHGGPGRAGGSEEMGGVRGVLNYMQRTAIQGHPDLLTAISDEYVSGAASHSEGTHPFTRSYHKLSIGDSIQTAKRLITIEDIEHFAHFTGDTFYAHMDDTAARANPFFPGRVAHGYLLLSFAAGLFVEPNEGPVLANTGLNNLQFMKPVVAGDSIYVNLTVKRKTRRTDQYGEVRWHVEIKNQNDEFVATYELLTMNAYENSY